MKDGDCIYLGVDVSKNFLDIYSNGTNQCTRIPNNKESIKKHFKNTEFKKHPIKIACESTGGYHNCLHRTLSEIGCKLSVINPRQVRDFAKASGALAKTDAIDARIISHYLQTFKPTPSQVPTKAQIKLKALRARRDDLMTMLIAENNRSQQCETFMKKSIQKMVKTLKEAIESVEKKILVIINEDPSIQLTYQRMISCKGVGATVAQTLITELPELGRLNKKAIAKLVGVAPLNQDSGLKISRRITWGGRKVLRSKLYMAALVATKHNPDIRAFYARLCGKGKPKKLALVACMRKLLVILNTMEKNKEIWKPRLDF